MTIPTHPDRSMTVEPATTGTRQLTAGAGIALVGIWIIAAVLSAFFFCILSYTSVLMTATSLRNESTGSEAARLATYLLLLFITLCPAIVAYKLSRIIIGKG